MNECGPLDLVKADPTAEERLQYHIGGEQGDGEFYICARAIK